MAENNELGTFITLDEYKARWDDSVDDSRTTTMLTDASNQLRQITINNGRNLDSLISEDTNLILSENVKMVVANSVHRVLQTPRGMAPDATNWSQSATPYSESMSFTSGSAGNLYFKVKELDLLGLGSVSGRSQISILRGVR